VDQILLIAALAEHFSQALEQSIVIVMLNGFPVLARVEAQPSKRPQRSA
jgi:hypothetical protein